MQFIKYPLTPQPLQMAVFRRTRATYLLLLLLLLLLTYGMKLLAELGTASTIDFTDFDNTVGSSQLVVPNILHFIHFDSELVTFITFICILSVHYNHRPAVVLVHTNMELRGRCATIITTSTSSTTTRYYTTLVSVMKENLKIIKTSKPSHVFGQKLSSVQHSADVARIKVN